MAALYLHQALFANDTPPPTAQPHRNSHGAHDLSLSAATLRNSTSEHSYPTEPLLLGPYASTPAYQDILANQPIYSEANRTSWATGLSLLGDPVTSTERKRHRERLVRRRLRRLRWAKRVLRSVIAGWGAYTTVRYFVAFTIYAARDRHIALLVLGTASALSFAATLVPVILPLFAPRLGWRRQSRSLYMRITALFSYTASLLLLGPAAANVAFLVVWRHSVDPGLSAQGRCHWDVDIFWTGMGLQCSGGEAVAWGFWLTGSVARLVLTLLILLTYYGVSYQYLLTRVPQRRRRGRTHSHSISVGPGSETLNHSPSTRSLRTMVSTSTAPIVAPRILRKDSSTSESDFTHESGVTAASSTSKPRTLRRSQSRISADRPSVEGRPRPVLPLSADRSLLSSDGHGGTTIRFAQNIDTASASSSAEDLSSPPPEGRSSHYGSATGGNLPAYTPGIMPAPSGQVAAEPTRHVASGEDVQIFVDRFRAMMEQVARETEAGLELAQNDDHGQYDEDTFPSPSEESYSLNDDGMDYVPVVGRIIQRMPTIESLGSREMMSLASAQFGGDRSVHTLSRPPTRANTLTMSEVHGSPSVSRSNSITASVVLGNSPIEAPSPSSEFFFGGSRTPDALNGSKSTASYLTAVAAGASSGVDSAAAASRDAELTRHEQ